MVVRLRLFGQVGRDSRQLLVLAFRTGQKRLRHVQHHGKAVATLVGAHHFASVGVRRNAVLVEYRANGVKQNFTPKRHALFQVHLDWHGFRPAGLVWFAAYDFIASAWFFKTARRIKKVFKQSHINIHVGEPTQTNTLNNNLIHQFCHFC